MWGLCHFSSSGLQVCWSSFHSLYKNGIFLDLSHRAITMAQFNVLPFCLCLGSKLLNICWASSSNWDVSWSNWIMKAMSMLSFHTFFLRLLDICPMTFVISNRHPRMQSMVKDFLHEVIYLWQICGLWDLAQNLARKAQKWMWRFPLPLLVLVSQLCPLERNALSIWKILLLCHFFLQWWRNRVGSSY